MKKKNIIDELSLKMITTELRQGHYSNEDIICEINNLSDVNMVGRGKRTLLMQAVCNNKLQIAQHLINIGANIHSKDSMGVTALHMAVENDCNEMAKMLLDNGALVNDTDMYGNTPLHRAGHQNIEIIQLLMLYGANPDIANNYNITAMNCFEAYPQIIVELKKHKEE